MAELCSPPSGQVELTGAGGARGLASSTPPPASLPHLCQGPSAVLASEADRLLLRGRSALSPARLCPEGARPHRPPAGRPAQGAQAASRLRGQAAWGRGAHGPAGAPLEPGPPPSHCSWADPPVGGFIFLLLILFLVLKVMGSVGHNLENVVKTHKGHFQNGP